MESRSAASKQSMPTVTVPAEARMAGKALQCAPHRSVPILVAVQLLAVPEPRAAAHSRSDAEDEHRENADALRVDDQAEPVGEQPDDGVGQQARNTDDRQRKKPEHRCDRSVEHEGDDYDGRDQQCGLDAVECRFEVGRGPGRSGDEHREPWWGARLDDVSQGLDVRGAARRRREAGRPAASPPSWETALALGSQRRRGSRRRIAGRRWSRGPLG